MTREEIFKLKAGPELDRLIAERVMEWRESSDFAIEKETGNLLKIDLSDSIFKGLWKWSPSTDVAAAWEVVEYMAQKQFDFTLSGHGEKYTVQVWNADPGANRVRNPLATVYGPIPLAICQAALLAVKEADNEKKGGS